MVCGHTNPVISFLEVYIDSERKYEKFQWYLEFYTVKLVVCNSLRL